MIYPITIIIILIIPGAIAHLGQGLSTDNFSADIDERTFSKVLVFHIGMIATNQ